MNRIILILCLCFMLYSCGTKKTVVNKRSSSNTEQVENKGVNTGENETDKPKVYASNTKKYIDTYKAIAQREMELYNIPASITLAQGILESGNGNGRLSVKANNHFGIKCHDWTGARIYHDDDKKGECFRKYKDAKYSFRDHSLFLSERKRYAALFKLKKSNYKAWAKGLKAAGYATDKRYPQKLISLIERYKLHEFDKEVLGDDYVLPEEPKNTESTYVVVKGDTLYSISKKYNITVNDLQKMNELYDTSLSIGQELIIKLQ